MTGRWTDGVRREVLANGLTVLVKQDASAPAVSVITHVKAGFFDEPDRWVGVSHVLEHMFFKGTPRRGPGDIARATKAAGGYLNASTSYDRTCYYVVLPADRLATAVDIQADALQHSLIDPDELARELQVIIQEARRKLDSPGAVAHETMHEVLYDRHRIRRWRIGREADLAGLTRDDIWGYYRSRYVPRQVIVTVVGDVDPDAALDLVRRAYGDWADAPPPHDPSPAEPPHAGVRTRTLRGEVAQAHLAFGWQAVPPLHPDAPALDLAAAVLGLGRGSWLYRALREPGLVTAVSAGFYAPTELGVFNIGAELDPSRLRTVTGAVMSEVTRLAEEGVSPDDMQRARTLLLTRYARRLEPTDGMATALSSAEALRDLAVLDEEYEALRTVDAEAVRDAAARYLAGGALGVVAYLPTDRGDDLEAGMLRPAGAGTAPPVAATPGRPRKTATGTSGSVTADVWHFPLDGLDLLVRRKPGVPAVTLGVYLPRSRPDDPQLAGIGALGMRSVVRGAAGMNAAELAFAFERLGGSLSVSVASDWLGLGATVITDQLSPAAGLLHLALTEPTHASSEIERERGLMAEEAGQVVDDMFRYPFQLAFRAAFGDQGYGLPVAGLPDTLAALTPELVTQEYADRLAAERPVVVAVGDIDPQRAGDDLAGVFGRLPQRPAPGRPAGQEWAVTSGPAIRVVARDKAQSAVAMGFPGVGRADPDHAAAEVWAAVASGLGGRLFESLRSRRSLAYTVVASAWSRARGGALVTYIATSPEREEEAREAMLEELAVFGREPVTGEELGQAVGYLAGQAEVQRQTGASVAGEILDAWVMGRGLADMTDPAGEYRKVTAEAILRVARRGLRPELRAEGIIRGRAGG